MTRRWMGGIVLAIAVAMVAGWKLVLSDRLERARDINVFVQRENAKLEREVDEVKDLEDRVRAVIVRKTYRETVLASANMVPEAIAALSRLPREIVLHRIVVKGRRLTAWGEAASEADLARVLPALQGARYAGKFALSPVDGVQARGFRLDAEIATAEESANRRGAGS